MYTAVDKRYKKRGKSMDFATRRVTGAMTILCVWHCVCYDAFDVKGAIFRKSRDFFAEQRSGSLAVLCVRQTTLMQLCGERIDFPEIERFLRETKNKSDGVPCVHRAICSEVFTEKESIYASIISNNLLLVKQTVKI